MAKKKSFSKEAVQYETPAVETPYLRAKQAWDTRIGSAVSQARNWRLVAFFSLLLSLLLLILMVYVLSLRRDTVFVAQVTQGGQVVNVAPLEVQYNPTQAQQEYFLRRFIELSRSLPLDPVLARKDWVMAYGYLTQRAAAQFTQYMQTNALISKVGQQTNTVDIQDINPMSNNSYQVDWTETTVDTTGRVIATENYSGVFTLVTKQPTTQQEILANPLGIYVANFDISRRDD